MIHILDYGLGNVQAFLTMYKRLGIEAKTASTDGDLVNVSQLILPGVGAFDHAMQLFNDSGLRKPVEKLVFEFNIPVLGICVGMQMLSESSDEGSLAGLGWVPGHVKSFKSNPKSLNLPMPHMGWNDVTPVQGSKLFNGIEQDSRFYFLHSYYFECLSKQNVEASAFYGSDFHCAVKNDHIYGVQFHPEKSHHWGAALLRNFAELNNA